MRTLILVAVGLLTIAPFGAANHDAGCVPGGADPATYNVIVSPLDGRTFYIEERGDPLGAPVPGSGFLLGDGTWTWEETNGLPGLQRGGEERCYPSDDLCIFIEVGLGPEDENCGHGPDRLIL
jgi:hypothetical protein